MYAVITLDPYHPEYDRIRNDLANVGVVLSDIYKENQRISGKLISEKPITTEQFHKIPTIPGINKAYMKGWQGPPL